MSYPLNSLKTKAIILLSFTLLATLQGCVGQDCHKIPATFSSYEEALKVIKYGTFKIKESVNTSESSWIRGATFYSCESKGFLLIKTDNGEYIHQNLPIEIWKGFKSASSFGIYYNNYIKGNYPLILSS